MKPEAPAIWVGLMSGTSVDAIDAVAITLDTDLRPAALVAHHSHPWPVELQTALQGLPLRSPGSWTEWLALDIAVADTHAAAISGLLANPHLRAGQHIAGIGFHGQTIFHAPQQANTLQIGSAAHLAAATGLPVFADFRRADMAAGGQGAPLAPLFHETVFGSRGKAVAVINLGGIANISVIESNRSIAGYDTGPANGLMDGWCLRHFQRPYDADGQLARKGQVVPELLAALLAEPYFSRDYPKSTGREYFSDDWLNSRLNGNESPLDVLRTLLELSVTTVAMAAREHAVEEIYVVGGGSANPLMMERLAAELPRVAIRASDALGWPPQAVEGAMIALLAARCEHAVASDCTRITGARKPTILGARYAPPVQAA